MEHLETEVKGLLGQLEELAWNLPPGSFSPPTPDLFGDGEQLGSREDSLGRGAGGGCPPHRCGLDGPERPRVRVGRHPPSTGHPLPISPRIFSALAPTWRRCSLCTWVPPSATRAEWPPPPQPSSCLNAPGLLAGKHSCTTPEHHLSPLQGGGGARVPCHRSWGGAGGRQHSPSCPLSFRWLWSTRARAARQLEVTPRDCLPSSALCKIKATPLVLSVSVTVTL